MGHVKLRVLWQRGGRRPPGMFRTEIYIYFTGILLECEQFSLHFYSYYADTRQIANVTVRRGNNGMRDLIRSLLSQLFHYLI